MPPVDPSNRRPTRWSETERLKAAEESGTPGVVDPPKPYTTPPGWRPPSLSEQWVYANRRHPYKNYGLAGVLLLGGVAWWAAADGKKKKGGGEKRGDQGG